MRHTRFFPVLRAIAVVLLALIISGAGAPEVKAAEAAAQEPPVPRTTWVYVGTSTQSSDAGKRGIYRMRMDVQTGALTPPELAYAEPDAYFLALHPGGRFLYAINNINETAYALALSPDTGALTLLNRQPEGGKLPSHLTVDAAGKHILVAAYMGPTVSVLPILDDGRLGAATCVVHRQPLAPGKNAKVDPHPHCINLDPSNRFALGCDFGIDQVFIYRFDAAKGTLTPNDPPMAPVAAGCGPRHLTFDPSGRTVYAVGEDNSTVTVFAWDGQRGTLKQLQAISTLPADFHGQSWPAEVLVHPSGRFLYATNRGHESIAMFAIDAQTRLLKPLGYQPSGGKRPQHIAIDPTGTFMLAANQNSDQVVEFRIDPNSGTLKPTGATAGISQPSCILFVPTAGQAAD